MARPGGPGPSEPQVSMDEVIKSLTENFRRLRFPLLALIVAIWMASGVYIVSPGEVGVVRQFGRHVAITNPGPNYHLPWPFQTASVVNMEVVRRAEVGFRSSVRDGQGSARRVPEESLMLTGDENIVEAQVLVQYRVKDPAQFLFKVRDPEFALRGATEVAIRGVMGNTTIDDALTVGRATVEAQTSEFLQRLLDNYETGLQVLEVKLLVVDPPDEVKDAFHEVVRAFEDRERLIKQAEGYMEDVVPKARGDAQRVVLDAEAYQEQRVRQASGEAEQFLLMLEAYRGAEKVTRERLYLETIEKVLGQTKKYIIDSQAAGGNLLQFLPLGGAAPADTVSPARGGSN